MKSASALAGFLMMLLPASSLQAAPQQPIGSTLVVVNLVTAEFNRDTRTLQSGDSVHQDELIEVGLDASSEIKLADETKLALGPGSRLMLDKFVYDAEKTKGSIVLDLVKGSFRFVTGVAEKPTYVIKTPSAAITVRGTIFDVYVEDDGEAWLLLLEGAIQVCNTRGECQDLTEPGKLIRISGDGKVGPPSKWASLNGSDSVPFDNAFPFVSKAPTIDPTPVLTRDIIILGKLPEADPPKKRPETTQPPKKRAERTPKKTKEKTKTTKTKTKKKTRTAKSGGPSDEQIMRGVGTAIGIGLAIGIGKGGGGGKHRGGSMTGGRQAR